MNFNTGADLWKNKVDFKASFSLFVRTGLVLEFVYKSIYKLRHETRKASTYQVLIRSVV